MTAQPTRDQLRALANAATPGPWEAHVEQYSSEVGDYHGAHIPGVAEVVVTEFGGDVPPLSPEDADLIEAYHRAVPQLLDQLDQAEAELDSWMTRAYEAEKRAWQAEKRIKAVRELHRQFGVYEHEDECPDASDEHREAHHHEDSDGYGEAYCDQRPLYTLCDHCRDESGERLDWPCPTIRAMGGTS